MSDTTGGAQDSYISLFEAARLLRVSLERITWFIATGQISSIKNPRNKSDRLVSLRDVYGLRNSPHLLARMKADHHKISRLVNKGIVQARDNPLDTRVRLVNFNALQAVFREYNK